MADKDKTKENDNQPTQDPVPGREGPSVQDVNVPTNPREDTEKAAEAAIEASKDRDMTPSMEKGSDAEFNTWMRKAHEQGNPEQLSPMQAEQNIRDRAQPADQNIGKQHDMSHEDTAWVVNNGLAS